MTAFPSAASSLSHPGREKTTTERVGGEEERRRMCDEPEDLREVWCSRRELAPFRDWRTCMEVVISCRAESASCCLVLSSALCSAARLFSSSTSALASFSLDTPACRRTAKRKQSRHSFSKVLLVWFVAFFCLFCWETNKTAGVRHVSWRPAGAAAWW